MPLEKYGNQLKGLTNSLTHSHLPEYCTNVAWEVNNLGVNFRLIESSHSSHFKEDEHLGLAFSSATNGYLRVLRKKYGAGGEVWHKNAYPREQKWKGDFYFILYII